MLEGAGSRKRGMFPSSLWKEWGVSDLLGSQTRAALGPNFPLGVSLSVPASPPWPMLVPAPRAVGAQPLLPLWRQGAPLNCPWQGLSGWRAVSRPLPSASTLARGHGSAWLLGLYKSLQSINCFLQLGESVCKTSDPHFSSHPRGWEGSRGTAPLWERSSRLFQH